MTSYASVQWNADDADRKCYDCDRKRCFQCNKNKGFKDFSDSAWALEAGSRDLLCRECTFGRRERGMWTCNNKRCRKQKPTEAFSKAIAKYGKNPQTKARQCDECMDRQEAERREVYSRSLETVSKRAKK